MRVVAISDTHNNRIQTLPAGDILIHAGDITALGRHGETEKSLGFFRKFRDQFEQIVFIAGNHDFLAEKEPGLFKQICQDMGYVYLADNGFEFRNKYIYGTPWTPTFYNWAFMTDEAELARKFHWIPEDVDILITHGPPRFILDQNNHKEHCGSWALAERVKFVKPKAHIFGHIHGSHGVLDYDGTKFVNAALTNDRNELTNWQKPIVFDLED